MSFGSLKAIPTTNLVEISTSYPTPNQLYTSPHLTHDSLLMIEWSVTELLYKSILYWLRQRLNCMRKTSFIPFMVYPWPKSQVSRGWGTFIFSRKQESKILWSKFKPLKLQNDILKEQYIIIHKYKRAGYIPCIRQGARCFPNETLFTFHTGLERNNCENASPHWSPTKIINGKYNA